jgi:adenylosuccinate lyase
MHELIRRYSIESRKNTPKGGHNRLANKLKNDPRISRKLKHREIDELLDPSRYIGDALDRCRMFVKEYIDPLLKSHKHMLHGKVDTEY